MATKTFSGTLSQAMDNLAAEGNKIIFVPQQTVGDVLTGASSIMTVDSDGSYSVDLSYNTYSIYHYSDVSKRKIKIGDNIVVATDTTADTLSDLITSATGELTSDEILTIQGYLEDAETYATDAAASYTDTAALFDDFDDNVLEIVGEIHTDTPALSVPFNESGKLDFGYGAEYVSGLPVYGVDFSRASASTVINKSGILEELAADEIGIGENGAWSHGEYTNLVEHSEFDGGYPVGTSSRWSNNLETVSGVTFNEFTYSGVIGNQIETTETSCVLSFFHYDDGALNGEGERTLGYISFRDEVEDTLGLVTIRYDYDTQEYSLDEDGDYEVQLYEYPMSNGVTRIGVSLYYSGSDSSYIVFSLSSYAYKVGGFQLTTGTRAMLPYMPTTSSAATAEATSCTVPVNGNLPALGQPFTFVFDAEFNEDSVGGYTVWSASTDVSGGVILFRKLGGAVQWYHDLADGSAGVISRSNEANTVGRHRYALTFDGSTFEMYCDGSSIASRTSTDYCWFLNGGTINFSSSYRNQLKNFNIYHYAADAAEVASWGGAE